MRRLSDYSFILTFIWIGFIMAISFLENAVKYLTIPLAQQAGTDITKHVLSALNKTENIFAAIMIVLTVFSKPRLRRITLLFLIVIILLIQTAWLIPILTARATNINSPSPGNFDFQLIYTFADLIKVILLFMFGWLQVKSLMRNYLRHI